MAPVKDEDDPVIAEYDVLLTPEIAEQVYLLQYPNRPRNRPYSSRMGAAPTEMRIKPTAGFMEMDVDMSTKHNFNKYKALKWGDAKRISKDVHNATGTFGPAAGLALARPRAMTRSSLKGENDREHDLSNDLIEFDEAEKNDKVHKMQTLGGQIIRHDSQAEFGKPYYFVGAFRGSQLHLSKVHGTVQMRPNFHHLDAEEERMKLTVSRAQAEVAPPTESKVAGVTGKLVDKNEKDTVENRMKTFLNDARLEPWLRMDYVDEDEDVAYEEFNKKLKVQDDGNLPHLKSQMDNNAFLDAISAPRHDSPTRRRKRAKRREAVEIEDDEEEETANATAQAGE